MRTKDIEGCSSILSIQSSISCVICLACEVKRILGIYRTLKIYCENVFSFFVKDDYKPIHKGTNVPINCQGLRKVTKYILLYSQLTFLTFKENHFLFSVECGLLVKLEFKIL